MKRLIIIILVLISGRAWADPAISGVTGTVTHGQSIVVSGSGFGTKSPAAPLIWDDCEGKVTGSRNAVLETWDTAQPSIADDPTYNIAYRTSWDSMPQAHGNSNQYLAGGHYTACGTSGACNLVYVGINSEGAHNRWYVTYYLRLSDWSVVPHDTNYKEFRLGSALCDESDSCSCYYAAAGDPNSVFHGTATTLLDGNCQECSGTGWPDMFAPNPALGWVHRELRAQNYPGYLSIKTGNTEATGGPVSCTSSQYLNRMQSIGNWNIGGFARAINVPGTGGTTDNRMKRYLDDLYVDDTWSRIVAGNAATYSACTIIEPQIPSAWAAGEITCTVNQGALGSTAYLYVFDSDNVGNTSGFEITFGSVTTDTEDPTVSIVTADPASTTSGSVLISWTDSDNIGVTERRWRIGAQPTETTGTIATSPATVTGFSLGTSTLYIGAKDAAGNWGYASMSVIYTEPYSSSAGTLMQISTSSTGKTTLILKPSASGSTTLRIVP